MTTAASVAAQPTLPIGALREFPNNPRRVWGDMDGLAASIRANGIIEPLVVRPINGHGTYEIIAGARRFRAAKAAGLELVPVTLREASDQVALELAILENLQRHDVHPLDEALGIDHLMKADKAYTVDAVAAKLGKTPRQIRERLKLLALAPSVRDAFAADRITAGHALAIARLEASRQAEALKECFYRMYGGDADSQALRPLRDLEDWIKDHVPLDVAAPETAELFPDVSAASSVDGLVRLSSSWQGFKGKKDEGQILGTGDYRQAGKKDACGRTGVVVIGHNRGTVMRVCTDKKCKKHFPPRPSYSTGTTSKPQTAAEKKKAAEAKKREEARLARERAERARRDIVIARALRQVAAAAKTITPATLRQMLARELDANNFDTRGPIGEVLTELFGIERVGSGDGFKHNAEAKVAEAQLVPALTVVLVANESFNPRDFAAAVAPYKVDLKKLDAAVKAEQLAAAKASATEAKKKSTTGSAAKKASVAKTGKRR